MRAGFLSRAVLVFMLIMLVVWMATLDKPEPRSRVLETQCLAKEVVLMLRAGIQTDAAFVSQIPTHGLGPDGLNLHMTQVLIAKQYLSATDCRDHGNLIPGKAGQEVLVDSWERPFVFQIPAVYPKGMVSSTATGEASILPLPSTVWPPAEGPIQVWSLGPNGLDDRGKGDDILPPSLTGGQPSLNGDAALITKPGSYEIKRLTLTIGVGIQDKSIVVYTVTDSAGRKIITSTENFSDAQRWCLFWDSSDCLWVESSDMGGWVWQRGQDGAYLQTPVVDDPELYARMPEEVYRHMPTSIQKKFQNMRGKQ